MQSALDRFLQHLQFERRLSPRTRDAYQRDIRDFISWSGELPLNALADIQQQHIRNFISQRHREGLSAKSLQRRLAALRSWFRYLQQQGQIKLNPATGLRSPKVKRKLPGVLDVDQLTQLLKLPRLTAGKAGSGDHGTLLFFWNTAFRAGINQPGRYRYE